MKKKPAGKAAATIEAPQPRRAVVTYIDGSTETKVIPQNQTARAFIFATIGLKVSMIVVQRQVTAKKWVPILRYVVGHEPQEVK